MFKKCIGIEIAGKDLRLAVVTTRLGKLRLGQMLEIPGFMDLSVENRKVAAESLVNQHKLSSSPVFLSLARDQGIVRQFEFPVELREKLRSSILLQLETLCPWSTEEIYWAFSYGEPARNAKLIRATVAIIPRAALNPWIEFFKSIKLPLVGATLSSLSCALGVESLWASNAPTIVLDCESSYVEGSVVRGGQLFSSSQSGDDVNGMARAVVERLMALGRVTSIESVRLIVYGAAASSLEPLDRVMLPMENARIESSDKFGSIASALGGLRRGGFATNLIPEALRNRQSQAPLIPTYVLLLLTALLGLLLAMRDPYQLTVYASKLDAEIARIAPVARQVSAQQSELNKLSEKYRALSATFQNRDFNLEALRELTRTLPPSAWLTSYSYQDGSITVSGMAESASAVQKLLEDTALFKDVQFTNSVTKDAKGKDHFTLKFSIEVQR